MRFSVTAPRVSGVAKRSRRVQEIVMLTLIEENPLLGGICDSWWHSSARAAFIASRQSLGWVTEQASNLTSIYMIVHTIRASMRIGP